MKPIDIFGIVARVFGLSMLLFAVWYLVYGFATVLGLPDYRPGYGPSYFVSGVLFLIIGLYLLRGAPGLLGFAYPRNRSRETTHMKLHWFWRATIAVVVGFSLLLTLYYFFNNTYFFLSLHAWIRHLLEPWYMVCPRYADLAFSLIDLLLTALLPLILTLLVYCRLTRYFGPKLIDDGETRCRKCRYILRGISEPRCPECGERI